MNWLQSANRTTIRNRIALVFAIGVVTTVYCWPTNLFVDMAVPPVVLGLLLLTRIR
jgi:hypothetical protein